MPGKFSTSYSYRELEDENLKPETNIKLKAKKKIRPISAFWFTVWRFQFLFEFVTFCRLQKVYTFPLISHDENKICNIEKIHCLQNIIYNVDK